MATRYDRLHKLIPYFTPTHPKSGLLGKRGAGMISHVELICRFLNPSQIIDPHDSGIAGSILLNLKPDRRVWNPDAVLGSSGCIDRTEELTQAYFEYISGLRTMYAQVFSHGIT